MAAASDPGGHDPRQIDPAHVAQNEEDVARTQGSSDPGADIEEAQEAERAQRQDDSLDTNAVLEAMPSGNADTQDQVTQREPDTAHVRSGDSGDPPEESQE